MTDHNHEHECCGGSHHGQDDHECCGGHDEHGHGGCGCNDHNHGEYQMIQLTLEDGSEVSAAVVETFEISGKQYIALLPVEEENVLLYEFKEDGEGVELINIETDEEFDIVSQAFLELVSFDEEDEEYDEEEYEDEEYQEEDQE